MPHRKTQHGEALQTPLAVEFLIIGGGIAGLATAIALRRVGHHLLTDVGQVSGGVRLCPIMNGILNSWGLGPKLAEVSLKSEYVTVLQYHSGEIFGKHHWEHELVEEAGGSFIVMHYADFHALLTQHALSLGAQIRYNAHVIEVDIENAPEGKEASVVLPCGEVLHADVVIGADGPFSIVRNTILDGKCPNRGIPMGLLLWNTTVSLQKMRADPDLAWFVDQPPTLFQHFGDTHAVISYPVGGKEEFAMHIYTPDDGSLDDRGSWKKQVPVTNLQKAMGACEPRLMKLASFAAPPSCLKVFETTDLEDWVHDEAPLLLVGEAAHSIPAGSTSATSTALEDAVCLAELFCHLHHKDQTTMLLDAFQEIRQPRCKSVHAFESYNLRYMSMPAGPEQEARDAAMKLAYDQGKGALDGDEAYGEVLQMFAYDPEDAASDWWVQWGLLNERSKGRDVGYDIDVIIAEAEVSE
ncbi:hypothetical protein JAAARDRAFT_192684 [Jaapia argillacea MUCL 33604]|uniref:FAD-binding domain-containing protein n=1 Tax=Jaapia argillacea MUCL 33604 TaxID=933084 RepID=A0A067Q6N3_9AGAM|nr:hypothetical protein JAAARDRAFT_192684 [Jaapia argillacea MUCL 33604]